MHRAQKLINHVALVLDGSSSMYDHKANVIRVADEQIRYLALRSEELQQETRVSVYLFADRVECLIFDMDVMRLPSIDELYQANGMTALKDAVVKSQQDLATTSQIYGDHAFLSFVLTDGYENASRQYGHEFISTMTRMQDNWTVAFLVPNRDGVTYLNRLGVGSGNIAIWDTNSAAGLLDAAKTIRVATDNFMTGRATGVRGTRNMFSTGAERVNTNTVKQTLTPLSSDSYKLLPVQYKVRIDDFAYAHLGNYYPGKGYYQLSKTETIQPQKDLIVVDKATGEAYGGDQVRGLIGLPNESVRVKPDQNPKYDIFVQSTSVNRNLMPNTRLLYRV